MINRIKRQWFLIGLVLAFISVVIDKTNTIASAGNYLKMHNGSSIVIFLIFIVSGLIIDIEDIKIGIKDIPATSVALVSIIIIAPVLAGLLSFFSFPKGLLIGIFIVAVMPTTLSSGIVMTGKAGGNMAHALFITIISNAISVFSIPIILSWLLSCFFRDHNIAIDQIVIMKRLIFLVMLPLVIGFTTKIFLPKIENAVKIKMQVFNQILIIGIVFMAASGSVDLFGNNFMQLFLIIIISIIFHTLLLGFSFYSSRFLKIGKGRYESIIFMGSQKTLALAVIIQLTYFSEYGIALLFCVVHHFVHLMIDGYLCVKVKNYR